MRVQTLAWKEINYAAMGEKEKMQLVAEVNILRDIKHTNVVRYYERVVDKENMTLYIIMEYCDGGDLTTALKRLRQERCAPHRAPACAHRPLPGTDAGPRQVSGQGPRSLQQIHGGGSRVAHFFAGRFGAARMPSAGGRRDPPP